MWPTPTNISYTVYISMTIVCGSIVQFTTVALTGHYYILYSIY